MDISIGHTSSVPKFSMISTHDHHHGNKFIAPDHSIEVYRKGRNKIPNTQCYHKYNKTKKNKTILSKKSSPK